jgi:hypothetical protein
MKNLFQFIVLLIFFSPLTLFAFDWGTAIRTYNIMQSATPGSQSKDHRMVEQLAKKIDNGDEIFVTESTRKTRFANRFEQRLTESGVIPSRTPQNTSTIKIEQDGKVAYELWDVALFTNSEGEERLAARRYFLFCDKKIIGTPGSVYYDMTGEIRTVDKVYLMSSVFSEVEYHGGAKKAYEAVCNLAEPSKE